tara:strand:+ start:331 stop:807 length:477 start_codon:yes stop_codon:yes gene_type:complete
MKKKIRIFGDLDCEECIQTRNIIENYDWSGMDVEIQIMVIEEEKEEWEKVMKRTGVYFVPHYEVKWEDEEKGEQEIHLSKVRDFDITKDGFDKLLEVLEDDYEIPTMSEVEIREQIKSLGMMQGILYERYLINMKNFTNLRNFINMPGSMINTGDPNA